MCSSQSEADVTSPLPRVSKRIRKKVITADYVIGEPELTDDEESEKNDNHVKADNVADFDPGEADVLPKVKKRGRPRKKTIKTLKKIAPEISYCNVQIKDITSVNREHVEESENIDKHFQADIDAEFDSYETEGVSKIGGSVNPPKALSIHTPPEIDYTPPKIDTCNVEINDYMNENREQNNKNDNDGDTFQNDVNENFRQSVIDLTECDPTTELEMITPVKTAPRGTRSYPEPTQNQLPASGSFSQLRPRQPRPPRHIAPKALMTGAFLQGSRPNLAMQGYYRHDGAQRFGMANKQLPAHARNPAFVPPKRYVAVPQTQNTLTRIIPSHPPQFGLPRSTVNSAQSIFPDLGVGVNRKQSTSPAVTCNEWNLPPGITITRQPQSDSESGMTLTKLGSALQMLGNDHGSKMMVRYMLTEEQIMALKTLGVEQL